MQPQRLAGKEIPGEPRIVKFMNKIGFDQPVNATDKKIRPPVRKQADSQTSSLFLNN
jgi:hypothetical protein